MAALRDRNKAIPNGLKFNQAETGWSAPPWASFDAIVKALISHRQGNPYLLRKHKWATEYSAVAFEVDAFNAKLCEAHGWTDFIVQATPEPPKFQPPHIGRSGAAFVGGVKRSAAGIKNVIEWLGSGLKPVAKEVAEARAAVCVQCPMNVQGNWIQKVDASVAEKVRSLLAVRHDLNLHTSKDAELFSCDACDCWLPLKLFCEINHIVKHTSEDVWPRLHHKCWIRSETGRTDKPS